MKAGASGFDATEDLLDCVGGVGAMGLGGLTMFKSLAPDTGFAKMLKPDGKLNDLLPGLSIATGSISALTGATQAIRGGKRWHDLGEQQYRMEGVRERTADQDMMLETIRHGKEIQKRNTILGGLKSLSGMFSAAGGIASLGGATTPLGFGLSAVGSLLGGIGSIYGMFKNRRLRKDAIAKELGGMSYLEAIENVRRSIKANDPDEGHVSRAKAWEIFLKSRNYGDVDEDELYKEIRTRRAEHMLRMAQEGSPNKDEAEKFIASMGISKIKNGDDEETYSEGALELLAEKLK